MALPTLDTGPVIDIGKKHPFEAGKTAAHAFVAPGTDKRLGMIVDYRKEAGNNNLVLFVHGFSGSPSETFGFTPDMLVAEPRLAGWDVFSIGYSSDVFPSIGKGIWSVNPDIPKIAMYLNTLLKNQFADYHRIAFVAHSMGGLAVQRALLDAEKSIQQKISHVILFGTPSAGLRKAFWLQFWSTQTQNLSHTSDFIKKLRSDWNDRFGKQMGFAFKTIAGSKDEFVPTSSSLESFDKKYWGVIEGNHITMIKPKDKSDTNHQSFAIIVETLTRQGIDYLQGDLKEINLLLGHYQTIINKYYDKSKELALRPLADLVFALECTGRGGDALRVLQAHPKAAQDSDTLGIIGGRYKRRYLVEGLQNDLDMAFHYYGEALKLSQADQHRKQVFYHAINLAFLNLVARSKEAEMKKYAQLALDNCELLSNDIWELATVAEAKLYVGDLDAAAQYYRKAAAQRGIEARSKFSIYSNAYYGYMALTSQKNENAAFIKMLETCYLLQ
jgi:pimeloyl-ACP methyl ester carboxylesterase